MVYAFPPDASDVARGWLEAYGLDAHSPHYYTLQELEQVVAAGYCEREAGEQYRRPEADYRSASPNC